MNKMVFVVSMLITLMGFNACKSDKNQQQNISSKEDINYTIDSSINRSQDSFYSPIGMQLELRGGVALKLNKLQGFAITIKSDKEFLSYYEQYLTIEKDLNEDVQLQYKKLSGDSVKQVFADTCKSLASKLPGIRFFLNKRKAPNFVLDNDSLLRYCKTTKGESDDVYFGVLINVYVKDTKRDTCIAVYLSIGNHNTVYSKMGDNSFLILLQQLQSARLRYPLFSAFYRKLDEKIREDILINKFYYSKTQVLAEYSKILVNLKHETYEEERIRQQIEEINSAESSAQFDCLNGKCR